MKNIKKKGLVIGIAILSALSIGYIVNSQNDTKITDVIVNSYIRNGSRFEQNKLSNNTFSTSNDSTNNYGKYKYQEARKDFDGIYYEPIKGFEPENQLWDGLAENEKKEYTLILKDTEIKKEIKDKTIGITMPIQGVQFCQGFNVNTQNINKDSLHYCSEPTDEFGKTTLKIENMAYGKSDLVEYYEKNKVYKINPVTKEKTTIEIKQPVSPQKIYVDLGVRFLGEVDGDDTIFISYKNLKEQIEQRGTTIGDSMRLDSNSVDGKGGKWLKFYDINENKVLYISKKPITSGVTWNSLYKAGVVYGLDNINTNGIPNKKFIKPQGYEDYKGNIVEKNGRTFIVRLMKENINNKGITSSDSRKSEWNKYILPLIKTNRSSFKDTQYVGYDLMKSNNMGRGYAIQLANYSWFKDLTNGDYKGPEMFDYLDFLYRSTSGFGHESWMQDTNSKDKTTRIIRGTHYEQFGGGASYGKEVSVNSNKDFIGFRPVLEEIPQNCYDGACFEGEVAGTDFITYRKLLEDIEGKSLDTLPKDKNTNKPKTKVGDVLGLGEDEITGGNWLKTLDYKEGKTIYIAKKPLTNYVSWQDLYKAGVVFGLDQVDKDTMKLKIQPQIPEYKKNSSDKTGKNLSDYKATKIEINGKPYIVRLLKGINTEYTNTPSAIVTQGSEWNRYIYYH